MSAIELATVSSPRSTAPPRPAREALREIRSRHLAKPTRVARTQVPALITDTRSDPDHVVRDPETDPGCELSVSIRLGG